LVMTKVVSFIAGVVYYRLPYDFSHPPTLLHMSKYSAPDAVGDWMLTVIFGSLCLFGCQVITTLLLLPFTREPGTEPGRGA
jgi:hypothetical protein